MSDGRASRISYRICDIDVLPQINYMRHIFHCGNTGENLIVDSLARKLSSF